VFTINEARALEGLPAVDGGDEIRVQQQDVPLSAWERGQQAAPAAPAPPADIEDDPEEEPVDAERNAESILGRLYDHASLH
jgi:hypothetical protein